MIKSKKPDIVIVDDFLEDPLAWRRQALDMTFVSNERFYKGHRSEDIAYPDGLQATFEFLLGKKIAEWEVENSAHGHFQYTVAKDHLVHHADDTNYAGALFLSPDAPYESGTNFWASKRTGYRHAPSEAEAAAERLSYDELIRQTFEHCIMDRTKWELVTQVGNVFNRLVLWPGNLIHSAGAYFGHDRNTARLVQLFFFNVEE